MYSSYSYFIYEFVFMCLFIYSLCIEVILSLFMNSCLSCILSWIICVVFAISFNIHHVFGVLFFFGFEST